MYDRRSRSTCTGLFHSSSSSSPRGFTRFTKRPGVRRIFDKLKKKSTTKGGKKCREKKVGGPRTHFQILHRIWRSALDFRPPVFFIMYQIINFIVTKHMICWKLNTANTGLMIFGYPLSKLMTWPATGGLFFLSCRRCRRRIGGVYRYHPLLLQEASLAVVCV